MTQGIIGIDIGGVIIDKANDDQDTSLFQDNYLNATEVTGAREAIKRLAGAGAFGERIWIVSKCGEKIERRSREWLKHNGFAEFVPESRWKFCRERNEKAAIAKELGLTWFVDDKLEVLHWMYEIVQNRILFQPWLGQMKNWMGKSTNGVQLWLNWAELAAFLIRTVGMTRQKIDAMRIVEAGVCWVEQRYKGSPEEQQMAKIRVLLERAKGEVAFDDMPWPCVEHLRNMLLAAHAFDAAAQIYHLIEAKKANTNA